MAENKPINHDEPVPTIQRMTLAENNDSVQNEIVGVKSDTIDTLGSGASTDLKQAAGRIFLNEIVKDVVSETRELNKNIMEKEQLLDFINKIELHFGSVDQNLRDTYDDGDVEVISARFSQAAANGDGKFLLVPLFDHKPIPLRKMGKGILIVSNRVVGWFDAREKTSIGVEDESRDPPSFVICLAGKTTSKIAFFIKGQVKHLSDDKCMSVLNISNDENRLLLQHLVSGQGVNSPEAVFIPTCLALERTSAMEDREHLVKSAITPPKFHHASNEFRHSVIDAIGIKSDINLLQQNCAAKFKKVNFTLLEDLIATVEVIINSLSFKFDLRQGRFVEEYYGLSSYLEFTQSIRHKPAWVLRLNRAARAHTLFSDRGSFNLFVSGAEVCCTVITEENHLPDGRRCICHFFRPYAVIKCFWSSEAWPNDVVTEFAFDLEAIKMTLNILGIACNHDA